MLPIFYPDNAFNPVLTVNFKKFFFIISVKDFASRLIFKKSLLANLSTIPLKAIFIAAAKIVSTEKIDLNAPYKLPVTKREVANLEKIVPTAV